MRYVNLYDGRKMPLECVIRDYERLLRKSIVARQQEVGEWFYIDRKVIDESKEHIYLMCNSAGREGKKLWRKIEKSNKIADENPDQYPRLIETYIFKHKLEWINITEEYMRDMCKDIGDGMCCEVICYLELQMRICNGERVYDLVEKADKLPYTRLIKCRNGETGRFGGGTDVKDKDKKSYPPAALLRYTYYPDRIHYDCVPYAFRRVL